LKKASNPSDIAVLVRTNKEAVLITNALLSGEYSIDQKKYPVISNESLIIGNSEAIQLIIAPIRVSFEAQRPDSGNIHSFASLKEPDKLRYRSCIGCFRFISQRKF